MARQSWALPCRTAGELQEGGAVCGPSWSLLTHGQSVRKVLSLSRGRLHLVWRRAEASALLAMASEAQALMGALAAVAECQRKLQEGCALEELYLDLLADDGDDGEGEDEWEEEEEEEEEPPTGPAAGRRGRVRR